MSAAWTIAIRSSDPSRWSGGRFRSARTPLIKPSMCVCSASEVAQTRPSGHRPVTGTGVSSISSDNSTVASSVMA